MQFAHEREWDVCGVPLRISQGGVGVTGSTIWDSSLVLCRHIEMIDFKGKQVIELGSGTGLVGLVAARLGGDVTLTDRPALLPLLQHNLALNGLEKRARVMELDWLSIPEGLGVFDFVLMSDCIYESATFQPLLALLKVLCGEKTVVLVSQELRTKDDLRFFQMAKELFTITRIPSSELDEVYSAPEIGVFHWVKK